MNSKKAKKTKSRQTRNIESSTPLIRLIKGGLRALLISVMAAFLIIFLITIVNFNMSDPTENISFIAVSSLILSALFCGFLCSKFYPSAPLWCGALSAFVYSLFVFVCSIFIPRGESALEYNAKITIFVVFIIVNFVGAILGNVRVLKRKRLKRR